MRYLESPGDQFAERMLFLMVVTLVWIQLQLHLGLEIKPIINIIVPCNY